MKLIKRHIAIYYYIRYSLIVYLMGLIFAPFFILLDYDLPYSIETIYYVMMLCCLPTFMILPGIIYEGKYKGAFHGITVDQFRYSLFLGLTLGIGPACIYFKKYDSLVKRKCIAEDLREGENLPKESGHQKLTKGGCPNGENQRAEEDKPISGRV